MGEWKAEHMFLDKPIKNKETYWANSVYIAGTEINVKHKALEIYVSGCKEHSCQGCHNPELWYFDIGKQYRCILNEILKKAVDGQTSGLIDQIWILGGEPCDQHLNLMEDFLLELRTTELPLVLWTHYTPRKESWALPVPFTRFVDYIKVGPYIPGKESHIDPILGVELANPE
ncbi:MAG: radical SAM protein, partial [Ruminococcus flavefaciens]|nr:radical SAM protein [Ruminococcus flavefaciens]